MAKTLNVLPTAYRCNIEEQDDPIVWITAALKGKGADVDLLLRGNAVNYAVKEQDASSFTIAGRSLTHPPQMANDLTMVLGKGIDIYVVSDDAKERGIDPASFIDGVKTVERAGLPGLFDGYERVWNW